MPAADALVGLGLAPSPYREAMDNLAKLQAAYDSLLLRMAAAELANLTREHLGPIQYKAMA